MGNSSYRPCNNAFQKENEILIFKKKEKAERQGFAFFFYKLVAFFIDLWYNMFAIFLQFCEL